MPNEKNLIPNSERTPEELRRITSPSAKRKVVAHHASNDPGGGRDPDRITAVASRNVRRNRINI